MLALSLTILFIRAKIYAEGGVSEMKNIKNFVWDFDGTLFDTYPLIVDILRKTLQEYGLDCDPVEARQLLTVNLAYTRDHYADKFGIDREECERPCRRSGIGNLPG